MPKISKISKKTASTKPGGPPPERPKLDKYICSRCGKIYKVQKSNFPASQSPLYSYNGYLPVCNHCVDNLYDHYKEVLGSGQAAMERICMKFDIYWNPDIYGMINKINTSASRVKQYISKTFLVRYIGKSYDDTLDEQDRLPGPVTMDDALRPEGSDVEDGETKKRPKVSPETVMFWGAGFDEDMYHELDMRYERWTKDLPKPLPIVEESLYKQICLQEAQINRKAALGQDVEKGQSALNSLLSSLNVKPNQKSDESSELESTPLGVWAKRWEDKRPIPDYDDEIQEPKIIKYISVWLLGHLAKALGLKNMYSQVYEDEIAKYRVEKPEYEEEDDDQLIADIVTGDDT